MVRRTHPQACEDMRSALQRGFLGAEGNVHLPTRTIAYVGKWWDNRCRNCFMWGWWLQRRGVTRERLTALLDEHVDLYAADLAPWQWTVHSLMKMGEKVPRRLCMVATSAIAGLYREEMPRDLKPKPHWKSLHYFALTGEYLPDGGKYTPWGHSEKAIDARIREQDAMRDPP